MHFTKEEKTLLLGALFHDIGKFEQRITNRRVPHTELGGLFFEEFAEEITKILDGDTEAFQEAKRIITDHHNKNSDRKLVNIVREADHLSASERVGFDEEDNLQEKWSHKYLTSLFSKIYLRDEKSPQRNPKYYAQKLLTDKDYKIIIPEYESEKDIKDSSVNYPPHTFEDFKNDFKAVLSFYESEDDFPTLLSLLLAVIEKYMWCIPDFTGSQYTDISLYNHLKDVAGIAHAIYKSHEPTNKVLNLIIGDMPGIQRYIFNVTYSKPAKILRGRSIYVQILTRQFASIILDHLGLTDANLIMLAGGKFYILAHASQQFDENLQKAKEIIDNILIENFNYQLSFSTVAHKFNYEKLKNGSISFGDIIDEASYKLLLKRNQQFENILFNKENFNENTFVLHNKYTEPQKDSDSNSIKCAVTDYPIKEGRRRELPDGKQVDKQVLNEYKIGEFAPKNNVIVLLEKNLTEVIDVFPLRKFKGEKGKKFLLNPDLNELLNSQNLRKDILRNSQIIEVANYATKDEKNNEFVMDFKEMEKSNNGAEMMTLIKGDVDNLGLIMSSGLVGNEEGDKGLTGISRTTTLSNHLKYFFSFTLNGFLERWEKGEVEKSIDDKYIGDQKVYTVFAGGDDLMIVCPQSSSLKLLEAFDRTFSEFVCENPEVHISYSLTNFKHSTPMRIVAEMAEDNQKKIKNDFKAKNETDVKGNIIKTLQEKISEDSTIFHAENDKAGVRLFGTNLKKRLVSDILKYKQQLVSWTLDKDNKVTKGILRNMLYFSGIIKELNETGDSKFLMWHPKLTYMINRLLKDKEGKYINPEVESFFDTALSINKKDKLNAVILEQILYPLISETIYATRNTIEGE